MKIINHLKKIAILLSTILAISIATTSQLNAQETGGGYLQQIAMNTYGILKQVNNLPNYLNGLGQFIISWMTEDSSKTTATMQASFATLGSTIIQDLEAQNNRQLQLQMLADLLGVPVSSLTAPPASPNSAAILKSFPNVNDVAYSSLLGTPPLPKAQNAANAPYNFIKNAGGMTLTHTMPGMNWQGDREDIVRYANYYNTVMAVESFNGYVLSNQYAEAKNGNLFNNTQTALITQASNSSWIAEIATEELGKVLRQILMFESQNYILLSQLIQTQKQALMAQTMTNALIILTQQLSESQLVARAQGVNLK